MNSPENADAATALGGGSIVIHEVKGNAAKRSTSNGSSMDSIPTNNISVVRNEKPEVDKLTVKVFPNPATYFFTFDIQSASNEKVNVKIFDITGKMIEQRIGVPVNGSIQLGSNYRPGFYIAEIIQGNERVKMRIIKGGE